MYFNWLGLICFVFMELKCHISLLEIFIYLLRPFKPLLNRKSKSITLHKNVWSRNRSYKNGLFNIFPVKCIYETLIKLRYPCRNLTQLPNPTSWFYGPKKKQIQITKHVTSVNRTTDNYIRRLQESKSEKITQICWYQANICLKSFCWYPFIPRTNEDNRRSTYTLLTNYNTISTIFLRAQSWKSFE